jgi:Flp pilus assembly CpaF family ATPase
MTEEKNIFTGQGDGSWTNSNKDKFIDREQLNNQEWSDQTKRAIEMIAAGLEDDDCSQIDAYGPGLFSAQYKGRQTLLEGVAFASEAEYFSWVKSLVDDANRLVDWGMIERDSQGTLALPGGQRLQIFLPPITKTLAFTLRKHTAAEWDINKFIELGMLDERMLNFLQAAVASKINTLFVGPMGSGKSSLMRSLINSSVGEDEKLAVLESIPELNLNKPLAVPMLYQDSIDQMKLDKIIDSSLYFGLNRLIVGEIHIDGLGKMLESMILTEGSMSTYHAFSAEMAAERMKVALQMEYGNLSESVAASYIRNAIELVVVVQNIEGVRRIVQVTEIDWRKSSGSDVLGGRDLFIYDRNNKRFRANSRLDENGRIKQKVANTELKELPDTWFVEAEDIQKYLR